MVNEMDSDFEAFFKENENTLYKIVRSYVRSRDTAKDIVLETMMRVYERWERVQHFDNKTGYAIRIGINMAKKFLIENRIKGFIPIFKDEDSSELFSHNHTPETSFFNSEEDKWLENELNNLKEIEKNIILLKDIDKKKFEEIAEIFHQKLPTVKSHYRRGKIKLASRLEEIYE
jgi:RNA polymerase sigma factor (sigma-70 family)